VKAFSLSQSTASFSKIIIVLNNKFFIPAEEKRILRKTFSQNKEREKKSENGKSFEQTHFLLNENKLISFLRINYAMY
jgi:hypothetical protein